MKYKKVIMGAVAFAVAGFMSSASASGLDEMVGKWTWNGFTVVVNKCPATGVCGEVVAGPKNVGMQMIKTKLEPKGDGFVGKIAHPQTGDTYNAKMVMSSADTWHMDGCTAQKVCASGDFVRVK
jgi:uncharacterized protein (DUF2147 family)